jgi:curved DNA-binding protein CbpA
VQDDPFAELGLPAFAELTNDDVRAAWRRIAAATHPDREDGGDPARFGAAAAAYVLLKTPFGRGEALADLGGAATRGQARHSGRARSARRNWYPRRPWPAPRSQDQRRGAHRLCAATPPARFRHARDGAIQVTRGAGIPTAGDAAIRVTRGAGTRNAGDAGFRRARYARLGQAGYARYRLAGYVTVDRGLVRPAGAAALGAAAAIAVVGWTPATIGLVAGALTVTAWGLWRRAWRDR